MARKPRGAWAVGACLLALFLLSAPVLGAHKPHYKGSVDVLEPGAWEAHFVWLRDPNLNYGGKVEWEYRVEGEGAVDVLFLDWFAFRAFREGRPFQPVVPALEGVRGGADGVSGLTGDLPYFLVFRNSGDDPVILRWQLFAEIDWRRWQGQEPGPTLDLVALDGSPLLKRGEAWTMRFDEPGFYFYQCFPHADMTAMVEVVPADEPGAPLEVAIRAYSFHPEVLRISQGTSLRWTNHDGVEHSVQVYSLPEGLPVEASPAEPGSPWVLLLLPGAGVAAAALWLLHRRRTRGDALGKDS